VLIEHETKQTREQRESLKKKGRVNKKLQEIHQSWSPIENRGKEKQSSLCLKINFSKNSKRNRTRKALQSLNKDRKQ